MAIRRTQLVNDEIYHVILRSVGDTVIFNDENDFYRGIFSLYEFNSMNPVNIWLRRRQRKKEKEGEALRSPTSQSLEKRQKIILVEILAFCFMPNHIHLLLKQKKDNGISQFMQKVGTGYANYFNKKYSRKGHLFSRFRSVHVKTDEQLRNVFAYIHVNALSLIEPGWKEIGIKNLKKAIKFLEQEYRWSSFFDFLGVKNFPSVTNRDFLLETVGGENGCKEIIKNWLINKKKFE